MFSILPLWNRLCPLRFAIVGVWNSLFSYGVFSGFYYLLGGGWGDVVVQVLSGFLGITNAYVTHRFFTYRSHGIWWKEYLRFYVVYGSQMSIQACLFFIFSTWRGYSGYFTQLVLTVIMTGASYWAHKHYSFKR